MKRLILFVLILGSATAGGIWLLAGPSTRNEDAETVQSKKPLYHCPMHPTYTSNEPGDCPICGMRLVPIELHEEAAHEGAARPTPPAANISVAGRKILYYTDAKNPHFRSATSGRAPDGTDLVPVYEDEAPEGAENVEGYSPVRLSAEQQQMMGIITARVRRGNLGKEIRTVGRITLNETALHHVHTKFEGYIEDIFVNYTGQRVSEGQPLFTVYSPEVLTALNEYLIAFRAKGAAGEGLIEAARRKLSLWDIDKRELEKLEKTGKAPEAITMYSPAQGYVMSKTVYHGMKIMPSDVLYDIADLSNVWVLADIYENDIPFIKVDQAAEVTTPYNPREFWKAKVKYIYPNLEEKTRTVKVRLELANPEGALKPEMFANVSIHGSLGEGLIVPESAVMTTGEREIVFVKREGSVFEPRELTTGIQTQDYFEALSGVTEGEQVVVNANFLLDSESKLKASITAMTGGQKH